MNNEAEQILPPNSADNQLPAVETFNLTIVTDYSTVCRVCATVTEMVIPIFGGEGLKKNLADKINQHLPITVTARDTLPLVVCYECTSTLLAAHELVECCRQADRALRTREARRARSIKEKIEAKRAEARQEKEKAEENAPNHRSCGYCGVVVEGAHAQYEAHLRRRHARLLFHCDECDNYVPRRSFQAHMSAHGAEYERLLGRALRRRAELCKAPAYDDGPEAIASKIAESLVLVADTDASTAAVADSTTSRHEETAATEDSGARDDFSDLSDAPFEPLPDAVLNAMEDSQDPPARVHPPFEAPPAASAVPGAPIPLADPGICIASDAAIIPAASDPDTTSVAPVVDANQIDSAEPVPIVEQSRRVRKCPHCPKSYTASSSYFYHLKYFHGGSKEHSCPTCGRLFGTRGALREHAALHEPARTLSCGTCSKSFRSKAGLYVHTETHSERKKHSCEKCGRAFRWSAALRRHLARHSGSRAHACSSCDKAFSVRADLVRHARTHRRARLACPCAPCGATFAQPRYLRAHLKRKHAEPPPPAKTIRAERLI